ncbi:hypothetical protein AGMMS50249_6310 [candidate division SR1 bacterium]|nr:hypothetical protein AGMMS50249_6310 [candidate division SR1 bacterium]
MKNKIIKLIKICVIMLIIMALSSCGSNKIDKKTANKKQKIIRQEIREQHLDMLDFDLAKQAFNYLNTLRSNPILISKGVNDYLTQKKEFNVLLPAYTLLEFADKVNDPELKTLQNLEKRPLLTWDSMLAYAAECKVIDMVERNYFSHVSPDGNPIEYWFLKIGGKMPAFSSFHECIGMEFHLSAGETAIISFIIDHGVKNKGHRKTILEPGLTKIGIGVCQIGVAHYICIMMQ